MPLTCGGRGGLQEMVSVLELKDEMLMAVGGPLGAGKHEIVHNTYEMYE